MGASTQLLSYFPLEQDVQFLLEKMGHDYTADICGTVLYALFFMLVCARMRPFLVEGRSLSSTDQIKLAFHVCLLGSSLLEIGMFRYLHLVQVHHGVDVGGVP